MLRRARRDMRTIQIIYYLTSLVCDLFLRLSLLLGDLDDDLADMLLALEVLVCILGLLEVEDLIDNGVNLARAE